MGAIYQEGNFYGVDTSRVSVMPAADVTVVGKMVQYVGETTQNYHEGYFYKCSEDTSTTPSTYSWVNVDVQNGTVSRNLSYQEYSVLSEEEKNDGTVYFVDDLTTKPQTVVTGFTPVGTIISVMGTTAPLHYLACEGQVVNISAYPELALYFEEQFGTKNHFGGNGTTTFGIPDLRGEFLRGTGTNSHADQGSGANVGVHQDASLPNFVGSVTFHGAGSRTCVANATGSISGSGYRSQYASTGAASNAAGSYDAVMIDASTVSSVYQTGAEAKPTNTSVLYCIATKNIYMTPENMYSTSEQVVGQWIDGKPIYQKVIDLSATNVNKSTVNSGRTDFTLSSYIGSSIKYIWLVGGCANEGTRENPAFITLTLNSTQVSKAGFVFEISNVPTFSFYQSDNSTLCVDHIIVQYTKITD